MQQLFLYTLVAFASFNMSACSKGQKDPAEASEVQAPLAHIVKSPRINHDDYKPKKPQLSLFDEVQPHECTMIRSPLIENMPDSIVRSGHCIYELRVDTEGRVDDIVSLECSDDMLLPVMRGAIFKARFHLKRDESGKVQSFGCGPRKWIFKITDEDGNLIPE